MIHRTSVCFLTNAVFLATLVGCGGGGSSSDASATTSSLNGSDREGRVAYSWSFDNGAGNLPGRVFAPTLGGGADQALTACINLESTTCRVTQAVGKTSGLGLQFNPAAAQSYAWLKGGSKSGTTCSSRVLQFDPYGYFTAPGYWLDYRMTVAMNLKADRIESDKTYHLFGSQNPVSEISDASFHLRIVNGYLTISLYPDGAHSPDPDFVMSSPSALTANEWHHVAVTYQIKALTVGGAERQLVSLYVDGRLVAQKDRNADRAPNEPKRSNLNDSCEPYFLGGLTTTGFSIEGVVGAVASPQGYTFPGVIDNLVFSNRAFTDSDIAQLATQ